MATDHDNNDGSLEPAAAAPRKQRRRSPGMSRRKKRMNQERGFHRSRVVLAHPEWSDEQVDTEAERLLEEALPNDPKVWREYLATAPVSVCPSRREISELVEVAAMRRSAAGQRLEVLLRQCKSGRPADRLLVTSTFERMAFEKGFPEIWQSFRGFFTDHRLLHWAYDFPVARGGMRNPSNIYGTLGAALDRWPDDVCVQLNMEAILELRELVDEPDDIGRVVLVDGTPIPAPREQRQYDFDWPGEEEFLRDGLNDSDFSVHKNNGHTSKAWRGPRLIMLVDVATGLVLAWAIVKGTRPEWEVLERLFQTVYKFWPDWEPEALVADAHFDNDQCHRLCEEKYGIHPIFPRATPVTETLVGHAHFGTPTCPFHGKDHIGEMKLVQSEGFVDVKARRELGLEPGEPADLSRAAHRWVCTATATKDDGSVDECGYTKRTMWKTMPRLYVYYAAYGLHRSRMARRNALLRRRNSAESANALVKGKGIGLGGQAVPKWVSTDQQMRWLISACVLSLTLRRLVHATGEYASCHAEAEAKSLLAASPPTLGDLQGIGRRLRCAAGRAVLEERLEAAALFGGDANVADGLASMFEAANDRGDSVSV